MKSFKEETFHGRCMKMFVSNNQIKSLINNIVYYITKASNTYNIVVKLKQSTMICSTPVLQPDQVTQVICVNFFQLK